MKAGQTPIHIQRWAQADYHSDALVMLLKARRDYRTLTFYRHFIDRSFAAGGDLPAEREQLAAIVEMPPRDVDRALEIVLGRLIFEDGDRLYQPRVRREVQSELAYREEQRVNGKKGGRPATQRPPLEEPSSSPNRNLNPPAPSSAPTPLPPYPPAGGSRSRSKRSEPFDPASVPIPLELAGPVFAEAWRLFLEFRTKIRKPFRTEDGPLGAFRHLKPLGPERAAEALRICREKDWQGVEYGVAELARRPAPAAGSAPPAGSSSTELELERRRVLERAFTEPMTTEQRDSIVEAANRATCLEDLRRILWPT